MEAQVVLLVPAVRVVMEAQVVVAGAGGAGGDGGAVVMAARW